MLFREELYRRLDRFFRQYDLLVTPTVPCTAWPFTRLGPSEIEGRPATPRGHAVFTPIFNHTYVLALASQVEAQNEFDFSRPRTPALGGSAHVA